MADETDMARYLKLVRSAARMSCIAVAENTHEAWFQMHGRMLWYGKHCKRTNRFICDIEEHAPRPWAKPSVGFFDEAAGVISETLRIEGCHKILCTFHGGGVIMILWIGLNGVSFVTEYSRTDGRTQENAQAWFSR